MLFKESIPFSNTRFEMLECTFEASVTVVQRDEIDPGKNTNSKLNDIQASYLSLRLIG